MEPLVTDNPVRMYQDYLVKAIAAPWVPEVTACAGLARGDRVLDLACGTGVVARHVAGMVGETGRVVAVDYNPAMLAVARELPAPPGSAIEWREGNAVRLELPSGCFDAVLCQQGLQFFPDPLAALREMRRVVKDAGRVVLSVWQGLEAHPVYEALLGAIASRLGASTSSLAGAFALSDRQHLRSMLDAAGFQGVEVISKSIDSHFPMPERFVETTLVGAAAVAPAFAGFDPPTRRELAREVQKDVVEIMQQYRKEEQLTFPMSAHIVVGHA